MSEGSSYRQILRSSSIMGGAQAVNYLVGVLRVKVVAVLLGPAGVGVIGLYTSATSLIGTVTGLGLQNSSVRAIARAEGTGDPAAVARTVRTLRRLCWATGLLGWLVSAALAIPLSRAMFKSDAYAWALAALGATLLLNAISGGQLGLLQGLRRIGDIARVQVAAACWNTMATLALYAWLGERGIVPVLLANAAVSLALSWWFARRVQVMPLALGWREAMVEARPMLGLGMALMWSGVAGLLVDLFTRTLISRELGVEAVGLYQAAWALSGMFAGFVLGAMGADFYPRLTAAIHDRDAAIRVINEQSEIGVLLALPGLLLTLAWSRWAIWLLYSTQFAPAADVLAWMVLGVFGRVLCWPMGFTQLALGASRWYVLTQTAGAIVQAALTTALVAYEGVVGAGVAFACTYLIHIVLIGWVARRLIGFRWSAEARRMIAISCILVLAALAANRLLPVAAAIVAGNAIALAGSLWSLRGLAFRLGPEHRLVHLLKSVPGLRRVAGT